LKETQLRIKVTLVAQAAWVSARTICDITCQKLWLCSNTFWQTVSM